MGNLWLNIRIWRLHLQAGEPREWSVRIKYNDYDGFVWRKDGLVSVIEAPWLSWQYKMRRAQHDWRNVRTNKGA